MVNSKKFKNKFPIIPPLFHLDKFITDSREKSTLFDSFFASQCTVLDTGSQLPFICAITENILDNVLFSDDDIITHIRGLTLF